MRNTLLLMLGLSACGGGSGDTPDAPHPDGLDTTSFKTLIKSDWSLQPNSEMYQCATVTVNANAAGPEGAYHVGAVVEFSRRQFRGARPRPRTRRGEQ